MEYIESPVVLQWKSVKELEHHTNSEDVKDQGLSDIV